MSAVDPGNEQMRQGGKLEMAARYEEALKFYKEALAIFKREKNATGVRDAEQAIYEMDRKHRYGAA